MSFLRRWMRKLGLGPPSSDSRSYSRTAFWARVRTILWPTWLIQSALEAVSAFFVFRTPGWARNLGSAADSPAEARTAGSYANPINWGVWAFQFAISWLTTRPWLSIGPTLPAMATVIILGVIFVERRNQSTRAKRAFYAQVFEAALADGDLDAATVAVGALIDAYPENNDFRFERAKVEFRKGNRELAFEIAGNLARSRSYGPAANWLVEEQFDTSTVAEWTPEQHQEFRQLTAIVMADPSTESLGSMQLIMARYFAGIGAHGDAMRYLSPLADRTPALSLLAAVYAKEIGDDGLARRHAIKARDYFEAALTKRPTDSDVRINLARALVLNHNEERAIQVLADGLPLGEQDELKNIMAEAMVTWANRLGRSNQRDRQTLLQRLQLVRQAADHSAQNPLVTDAIIQLTLDCRENENDEIATLRDAAVQGLDPASVHFIEGTVALFDNDYETAHTHLRLASKLNPNLPGVLNNLAMAIANKEETGSLEIALQLANTALEQLPGHPYILETRGQVYVKMKKYDEAIVDLEAALSAPELRPLVYPSLVLSYRALGQEDIASKYEMAMKQNPEGI